MALMDLDAELWAGAAADDTDRLSWLSAYYTWRSQSPCLQYVLLIMLFLLPFRESLPTARPLRAYCICPMLC